MQHVTPSVRPLIAILTVVLVGPSLTGTNAQDSGEQFIGSYEKESGDRGALTTANAAPFADGLLIEGPSGAATLHIDAGYLRNAVGDWGANAEFRLETGSPVFRSPTVRIAPFVPADSRWFTIGSTDSVLLGARPMWISASQAGPGERLVLNLTDGNTQGQPVFLSHEWLGSRGLSQPVIHHEDGSRLRATSAQDGTGIWVEVPHFSLIIVDPPDLDVKGRQAGITFPHQGEKRWDTGRDVLEIDVGSQLLDYDLLVPQAWIDARIPRAVAIDHDWTTQTVSGVSYYVISLSPAQTPRTLRIQRLPWDEAAVTFNFTRLLDRLDAGEPVDLPLTAAQDVTVHLTLVAVRNTTSVDENGTTTNWTVRVYDESASDRAQGINATLYHGGPFIEMLNGGGIISANLCADFHAGKTITNLGGMVPDESEGIMELVHTVFDPQRCPQEPGDDPDPNPGPAYPYSPPAPPRSRIISPRLFTDNHFRSHFADSDAAILHGMRGVAASTGMWDEYTGNHFNFATHTYLYEVGYVPGEPTHCGGHLRAFSEILNQGGHRGLFDNEVFVHATGDTHIADKDSTFGCGWSVSTPGVLASEPDSYNLGYDWHEAYKGFSSVTHLGLLMAEEMGHDFGEPDHPCQTVNGKYSSMCNSDFDKSEFWLHYEDPAMPEGATDSRARIIEGTRGYD